MEKLYFNETQSSACTAIIPGILALLFAVFCFIQIVLKSQVGNRPAPNWVLVSLFAVLVAATLLLYLQKLQTTITNRAIGVSFDILPVKHIVIPVADLKNITVRQYGAMKEFGGWGTRSNKNERCYTVTGNFGVEIELKSGGKKILIGTQQPERVKKVIDRYFSGTVKGWAI